MATDTNAAWDRDSARLLAVALFVLSPKSRYTGPLAEKIDGPDPATQADSKIQLLFDWYGVEPGDWETLARRLARKHVPGFQPATPKRKRGRPSKAKQSKPVGRPRKWADDVPQILLELRERWRADQIAAGVTKPKDAEFRRSLMKLHADKNQMAMREVERLEAGRLRNVLSRAKKSVSKPSQER